MNEVAVLVVLAAGEGRRMGALTASCPKPLLPFFDRAIVSLALDRGRRVKAGYRAMNAWYSIERALDWAGDHADDWNVVVEARLMGTGGGIRNIWERAGQPQGEVLIVNGDIISMLDLNELVQAHRDSGAAATMAVCPGGQEAAVEYAAGSVVSLPGHGGRARRVQAPTEGVRGTYVGASVIDASLIAEITATPSCIVRDCLSPALEAGRDVHAHESDDFHADLGTPARYLDACALMIADDSLRSRAGIPPSAVNMPGVWVSERAAVEDGVSLSSAIVGPGVRVRTGAEIEHAAVFGCEVDGRAQNEIRFGYAAVSAEE